jgi:DNA-binding NtrC family response regulator
MANTLTIADAGRTRFPRSALRAAPSNVLELAGQSLAITRVNELVRRAAALDTGVLLTAERGTDVDSVARELHRRSRRADAPLVAIECDGADPAAVAHALFGAVSAPAVPGAAGGGPGELETIAPDCAIRAARGGTLLLQDVTELPSTVQARLARIVRDGEASVDGQPVETDVRFLASALPSVEGEVHTHRFRADLLRRLAGVRIDLPPLRERREDVPEIAARLLEELQAGQGRKPRVFTQAALALVAAVPWPGNLAELRAAVTRFSSDPGDHDIHVEHVLTAVNLHRAPARFVPTGSLREARLKFEREYISAVLQHHHWRIVDAAQTLGIQRPNLYRKARQLGIPIAKITG